MYLIRAFLEYRNDPFIFTHGITLRFLYRVDFDNLMKSAASSTVRNSSVSSITRFSATVLSSFLTSLYNSSAIIFASVRFMLLSFSFFSRLVYPTILCETIPPFLRASSLIRSGCSPSVRKFIAPYTVRSVQPTSAAISLIIFDGILMYFTFLIAFLHLIVYICTLWFLFQS